MAIDNEQNVYASTILHIFQKNLANKHFFGDQMEKMFSEVSLIWSWREPIWSKWVSIVEQSFHEKHVSRCINVMLKKLIAYGA